ncbi:MAG: HAD-IC family P-type ATPase, partial [Pseudolysinimonas sp.]
NLMITKGAFDSVAAVSTTVRVADGHEPLAGHLARLRALFERLSGEGFRVLAVATRTLPARATLTASTEAQLEIVGLLAFADPEKADARAILADLATGGISVRMVTGDNRHAAAHIAGRVGIDTTTVFTGADVDARPDRALAAAVPGVHVFAELDPVQKERVIRAFRASGSVVGYLGDGINDAPPLHAADVGISVESAVAVAKQSASIVLLEKDLRVLLDGVTQGRRTFANTMKYIFMTMSANFGNMLSMAIASIALPFLPLLAGQILLINLLTDLPATLLATDEVDAAQLRRPQRWNIRLIRNYMIVFGAVSSVFDLTTFAILRWGFDAGAVEFRSAWFVGSVLTEVAVLFVLRTRGAFFRSKPSRSIVGASLLIAALAIGIPYSPLAGPLGMTALPGELLGLVIVVTLGYELVAEIVKLVFWRRRRIFGVSRKVLSV